MNKLDFEQKIKPMFTYVGTIGAIISAITYIAIVFIMVFGVAVNHSLTQTIVFALINAGIGFIIMQFLKIQGIDLAKNVEDNVPILAEYNGLRAKEKKSRSLRFFWITSVIKDIVIKVVTLVATTVGIIYVVISSSQNYSLLLLAVVNLFLFACFGLLSLVKAYDFFNEDYIPFVKERINERNEETIRKREQEEKEREEAFEAEVARRLEMAKKDCNQQRDVYIPVDSRTDILEPCNCGCHNGDIQPLVLDSGNNNNTLLDRSIHSRDGITDCAGPGAEENIQENKM